MNRTAVAEHLPLRAARGKLRRLWGLHIAARGIMVRRANTWVRLLLCGYLIVCVALIIRWVWF